MRRISVDELPVLLDEMRAFLGKEFILAGPQEDGLRTSELYQVRARTHPLTSWWQSFETDVTVSLQRGSFSFSRDSARLGELYMAMKYLSDVPNVERLRHDLRVSTKFYSTAFEIILAAIYRSKGYVVEITQEGTTEGESTSDLIIHVESHKVYVEAKCLEDTESGEEELHEKMKIAILRCLKKYSRTWLVHIEFLRPATGADCDRVKRRSCEYAAMEQNGGTLAFGGLCRVAMIPFGQWGQEWLPGPFMLERDKHERMSQVYGVEAFANLGGQMWYRNPHAVSSVRHFKPDISSRIIKQMQRSRRKMPLEEACLLHVLLPQGRGDDVLDIIDSCYGKVFKKLNKDYRRRLNAVVLSAQLFSPMYLKAPVRYDYYMIPNMAPRPELPPGFTIPAGPALMRAEFSRVGHATGWFEMTAPLEMIVGESMFWRCSQGGRSQIRLWIAHNRNLRAELLHPIYGRNVCEVEVDTAWTAGRHAVSVGWDGIQMTLAVDGTRIAAKRLK